MAEPDRNSMKSADKLFAIMDALQEFDGGRVTELSQALGMPKSTIHRHLNTLYENQYVVKEGGEYYLGMKLLGKGEYVQNRKNAYRLANRAVKEIASTTEERSQFIVEEHGRGVYVHTAAGKHAVRTDSQVGRYIYLHATACGKAVLANLSPDDTEAIIKRWGLPQETRHTVSDRASLNDELTEIRERGYAFNDQGRVEGLCSVGVPVFGTGDELVGALSVSGPSHRMKGEWYYEELPDFMLGIANEMELNIRYK